MSLYMLTLSAPTPDQIFPLGQCSWFAVSCLEKELLPKTTYSKSTIKIKSSRLSDAQTLLWYIVDFH